MLTRRALAASVGASVGACATLSPSASAAAAKPRDLSFPAGFRWGCATAAYQIEGAARTLAPRDLASLGAPPGFAARSDGVGGMT
ncbi:family 1 glycosylhydrolase [Phenylobacterium sp. LjRoot225]|uniref:family 1 glycosylhydrolase n=1 Tax=Phenylobacterium sp. LjRoot225 TaxID=3342285 RepID=UPI003F508214